MIRKKTAICFALALTVGLCGCGKKEVEYQTENFGTEQSSDDSSNTEAGETGENTGTGLPAQLGLGDERSWSETLHYSNGKQGDLDYEEYDIKVNAHIYIPEVDEMHTMIAYKRYLDAEDKLNIMKYFVDESTIERDAELEYTKEYYERMADSLADDIEFMEEAYKDYDSLLAMYKAEVDVAINYYEEKKEAAPTEEELKEAVLDYNGHAYSGSRDGVKYYFNFYNDEERNRSAFIVGKYRNDDNGELIEYDNKIELTPENASKEALKVCNDLGLSDFNVVNCAFNSYTLDGEKEYNSYVVTLGRDISGVMVDTTKYYYQSNDPLSNDEIGIRVTDLPYSNECVTVSVDESGVYLIRAVGLLKDCHEEKAVKLLDFDKIKEVIREELTTRKVKHEIQEWKQLDLIYLRVSSTDNPDEFCYIPVWRLDADFMYSTYISTGDSQFADMFAPNYMYLFVNAMDGSIIDLEQVGSAGIYMDAQGRGDYE